MGKIREKKADVGVKPNVNYTYDFGLFPSAIRVKVPEKQWQEYVLKRYEYEMAHKDLIEMIPKKLRT